MSWIKGICGPAADAGSAEDLMRVCRADVTSDVTTPKGPAPQR